LFGQSAVPFIRAIVLLCGFAAATADASGQQLNVTFSEWVKFDRVPRAAYLAGVLDQILFSEQEIPSVWRQCLGRAKRSVADTADDLADFGQRSSVMYDNVPDALDGYVAMLCPDLFRSRDPA
jgi:hypothetical protein